MIPRNIMFKVGRTFVLRGARQVDFVLSLAELVTALGVQRIVYNSVITEVGNYRKTES